MKHFKGGACGRRRRSAFAAALLSLLLCLLLTGCPFFGKRASNKPDEVETAVSGGTLNQSPETGEEQTTGTGDTAAPQEDSGQSEETVPEDGAGAAEQPNPEGGETRKALETFRGEMSQSLEDMKNTLYSISERLTGMESRQRQIKLPPYVLALLVAAVALGAVNLCFLIITGGRTRKAHGDIETLASQVSDTANGQNTLKNDIARLSGKVDDSRGDIIAAIRDKNVSDGGTSGGEQPFGGKDRDDSDEVPENWEYFKVVVSAKGSTEAVLEPTGGAWSSIEGLIDQGEARLRPKLEAGRMARNTLYTLDMKDCFEITPPNPIGPANSFDVEITDYAILKREGSTEKFRVQRKGRLTAR